MSVVVDARRQSPWARTFRQGRESFGFDSKANWRRMVEVLRITAVRCKYFRRCPAWIAPRPARPATPRPACDAPARPYLLRVPRGNGIEGPSIGNDLPAQGRGRITLNAGSQSPAWKPD